MRRAAPAAAAAPAPSCAALPQPRHLRQHRCRGSAGSGASRSCRRQPQPTWRAPTAAGAGGQAARIAVDPQVRARTGRRPGACRRQRSERPHHPGGRADLREGRDVGGAAAACRWLRPPGGGAGLDLLPWPSLDFSKFGPTELLPLSRIKKISGPNLHRNWVMIPHVTQFDEADVTDLEEFRKSIQRGHGQVRRQADHAGLRHQGHASPR